VVNTSTSLKVQYGYDATAGGDVLSRGMRRSSLTYPNGRVLSYDYGMSGGDGDRIGRVSALKDGSTVLARKLPTQ
jgi:hypothetical protein